MKNLDIKKLTRKEWERLFKELGIDDSFDVGNGYISRKNSTAGWIVPMQNEDFSEYMNPPEDEIVYYFKE